MFPVYADLFAKGGKLIRAKPPVGEMEMNGFSWAGHFLQNVERRETKQRLHLDGKNGYTLTYISYVPHKPTATMLCLCIVTRVIRAKSFRKVSATMGAVSTVTNGLAHVSASIPQWLGGALIVPTKTSFHTPSFQAPTWPKQEIAGALWHYEPKCCPQRLCQGLCNINRYYGPCNKEGPLCRGHLHLCNPWLPAKRLRVSCKVLLLRSRRDAALDEWVASIKQAAFTLHRAILALLDPRSAWLWKVAYLRTSMQREGWYHQFQCKVSKRMSMKRRRNQQYRWEARYGRPDLFVWVLDLGSSLNFWGLPVLALVSLPCTKRLSFIILCPQGVQNSWEMLRIVQTRSLGSLQKRSPQPGRPCETHRDPGRSRRWACQDLRSRGSRGTWDLKIS